RHPLRRERRAARPAAPAPGRAHDRPGAAGGADQGHVLTVRRNQRQCLGRPVFLDSASSHRLSHLQERNVATPGRWAALTPLGGGVSLTEPGGCYISFLE